MKIKIKETDGLGNAAVPAGYNTPGFGLGTAALAGPGPDQKLIAQSAAATPNGIDPINKGFQIGGAYDPLAEFEKAQDNPAGLGIGGGTPTSPMNSPSHPPMASIKEDGFGANANGSPAGISEGDNPFEEGDNPFEEGDNPFAEDGAMAFENIDALPAFEDIAEDPALAALPVDAGGVIEPIVVPDEEVFDPELGPIPDVALPLEEPIVEIGEDDVDVQIPENVFENDGIPESIPVMESFKLPENQSVIVSKGDQIFMLGHVREEFTPKFAESVFTRAVKSLCENKRGGHVVLAGEKREKVAIVGRSMLVEVAKDWRLPGTSTVFEAHDLLQIVSAKPLREGDEIDDDDKGARAEGKSGKKENDDAKAKEEAEEEKLKKEAMLAYRRWREAAKKKKEDDGKDEDDEDGSESGDDEEKAEKKAKKERAKREAAMLERQRTGGWI
jgi:hypothetical protein